MTYLGCQWLVTIFVVRLSSGYDAAGLLSLAMSVVGIFGTLATYKMNTYQISDIKHENTLGEYLGFRCFMLVVSFVACLLYAILTCPNYAIATVLLYFIFKAVGLVIDVLHATDQQHRRMDYIGQSFILQGALMLVAFVLIFWATDDLNLAIAGMTLSALLVLFLFDFRKTSQFEIPRLVLSREKTLFFLRTSLPAVLASLAASAILTVPKQYLSFMCGDEALGIYSSVAAPALIVQMGSMYLYGPLLDIFPQKFFGNDLKGFSVLFVKTVAGIIAIAVVCAALLQLFGSFLLYLMFGESIIPYVYLLQPVLLSTVATAFLWFVGDLLIALRNFKANFMGNVVALVAVLPLSILCVNLWDMNGVSFAGAAACLCGVAVLLVYLSRELRQRRQVISDGAEGTAEGR